MSELVTLLNESCLHLPAVHKTVAHLYPQTRFPHALQAALCLHELQLSVGKPVSEVKFSSALFCPHLMFLFSPETCSSTGSGSISPPFTRRPFSSRRSSTSQFLSLLPDTALLDLTRLA